MRRRGAVRGRGVGGDAALLAQPAQAVEPTVARCVVLRSSTPPIALVKDAQRAIDAAQAREVSDAGRLQRRRRTRRAVVADTAAHLRCGGTAQEALDINPDTTKSLSRTNKQTEELSESLTPTLTMKTITLRSRVLFALAQCTWHLRYIFFLVSCVSKVDLSWFKYNLHDVKPQSESEHGITNDEFIHLPLGLNGSVVASSLPPTKAGEGLKWKQRT